MLWPILTLSRGEAGIRREWWYVGSAFASTDFATTRPRGCAPIPFRFLSC